MAYSDITHLFHADWSTSGKKRYGAWAVRLPDGSFTAFTPSRMNNCALQVEQMVSASQQGCLLAGFDFPIGLPVGYAKRAGIINFLGLLPELGKGRWEDFYRPAEYYSFLGVKFSRPRPGLRSGKRSPEARKKQSSALLLWAAEAGITLDRNLQEVIEDGFGPHPSGEDCFYAVVRLFALIAIASGWLDPGEPLNQEIRHVEGWILGQKYPDHWGGF